MDEWPQDKRAVFMPKDRETLRPAAVPFIGREMLWVYAGTSDDDEPFPGQKRWTVHDGDQSFSGFPGWVPDEDLQEQ